MKKLLLAVCTALFIISAPLGAMEWGGLITNDSGISTPDFSDITFNQANGISLWVNSPLGENFTFAGEASYKFKFQKPKDVDPVITHIVDVPLLKISGDVSTDSGVVSVNAGRFNYVDGAGAVYSNTLDGVSVEYALPVVKFGAVAGYTGLLNSLSTYLPSENDNKFYNMAQALVPVGAFVDFSLFANQSLAVQGYAILDFASDAQKAYYANVILSGPITNSLFYSLASSFGSVDFKNLMNYSALTFMAFPSEVLSINGGVEFGSAEEQGPFSAFYSLASAAGGKISPKLGLTVATSNMSFDLSGKYNLTYDGSSYKGTDAEAGAGLVYNIFSDFQIGLKFNAVIDTAGGDNNNYVANLNVALAF